MQACDKVTLYVFYIQNEKHAIGVILYLPKCTRAQHTITLHLVCEALILFLQHIHLIIGGVKRAPYWTVQSRFHVIYIYVDLSKESHIKIRMPKCVGEITWPKHVHAQSQFWAYKTDL